MWIKGGTANERGFLKSLQQRLRDCYIQEWSSRLQRSSLSEFLNSFKTSFQCKSYPSYINIQKFRDSFIRFRWVCNALKINSQAKKDGNADTKCSICNLMENECHFLNFCKMYHDIRQKNPSRYIHVRNSTCVTYIITGKQVHRTRDVAMFIFNAFQQWKEMLSSF